MPLAPLGLAILGAYAVMSLVTFVAYGYDKRQAVRARRRIPERTLHLLELACGWPGAIVARTVFRHKRRKLGFSAVTAGIVILHLAGWIALWYFTR